MSKGYIYIWVDPSRGQDLLKIGKTKLKPKRKDDKLVADGTPYVAYDIEVADCDKAESLIRNRLREYLHGTEKDIFRLSLEKAIAEMKDVGEHLDKIEDYKKALTLDPKNASFYNNLGCSHDKLGNHAEAIEAYKQAIRISPNNPIFHNNLGCNYGKLRLFRKAIDAFKDSLKTDPSFVKSYFDLGFSFSQLGMHKEAADTFKQALKIAPRTAQIHYNLAHAYGKLGLHRESIAALEEAIRLNPDYTVARYSLGITHLSMGNKDGAIEQYRHLKKLDKIRSNKLFSMIRRASGSSFSETFEI